MGEFDETSPLVKKESSVEQSDQHKNKDFQLVGVPNQTHAVSEICKSTIIAKCTTHPRWSIISLHLHSRYSVSENYGHLPVRDF